MTRKEKHQCLETKTEKEQKETERNNRIKHSGTRKAKLNTNQ